MKILKRFKRNTVTIAVHAALGLVLSVSAGIAKAFEPFVVKDIRVEGLQRTEVGTVFTYLPVRVGETFNDDKAAESIRALFATGFFKDVKLEVDNGILVIIVDERPAIGIIELSGVKEFDKEVLKKALADNGLAESRIFDRSVLDRAEQELKRQYLSRGLFNAQVTATVAPLERNRVAITITVEEGSTTKIAGINIVGNKTFSESTLKDQFNLTKPTWISWYTKTDQYSKEKLTADLETLRSFYLDRGYFEFSVESSQVSISPDKSGVYISIAISEGEPFKVGEIKFGGDVLGRESILRSMVALKTGESFSGAQLQASAKRMGDYLGELGYAFANVQPVPVPDRDKKIVAFNFLVDPGRRAYVRKINVAGNGRTRDEVIRRELRQFEASWYDGERVRLSRERIERLDFFKEVNIETRAVGDAPDQVDLLVTVVEKPTNQLNFGIGFSSLEKISISAGISQQNFLGTGQTVSARVNTSRANRSVSLSVFDPYFTDDGISRSFDIYSTKLNASALGLGNYASRTSGIGLRFGIPYTEVDRVTFGLTYENIKLTTNEFSPARFIAPLNQYGDKSDALLLNLAWARDSRNSVLTPTRGRLSSAGVDVTLPGFKQRYGKLNLQHQTYLPLNKDFTLAFYGDLSLGKGLQGRQYPIFKNLYAGGIGSVRGFDSNTLGPTDGFSSDPLGAKSKLQGSVELILPIPGTGNDKTLRGFLFADVGNVFPGKIEFSQLRSSAGIGLSWISPVGPMKLSYGIPIKKEPLDKLQRFQFQVGTSF